MLISMEYATQENISGEIYTVGKLTKIKTNVYNICLLYTSTSPRDTR